MLRTLFVLAIIAFGLRHAVRGPFYAVLFYLWVAYFRPELWVWGGWLVQVNLSFYIGVFALLWGVMSFQLRWDLRISLLVLLVLHSLGSTLGSDYTTYAWPYWRDFAKAIAITWLLASVVDTVARLRTTLLIIGLSLGFETAKQGWFQLVLNPGGKNFNEIAFIGDNNGVAIAMLALCAIFLALGRTSTKRWERWTHRFLALGVLYRGIITYSRGGFLSAGVMALLYFIRSKRKMVAVVALVLSAAVILPLLPAVFWERMGSMALMSEDPFTSRELSAQEASDVASAAGRLHFWDVATRMANDHPFSGVGHNAYSMAYDQYDFSTGRYGVRRSVHSSWFGVLAELGYVGLFLYVSILVLALLACREARRIPADVPDAAPIREYAIALETSLVVIAIGGSFVIFQYSELLWHTVGLSIAIRRIAAEARIKVQAPDPMQWGYVLPGQAHASARSVRAG